MALRKLIDAIDEQFDENSIENGVQSTRLHTAKAKDLYDFINNYYEEDQKQYQKNKENKALTFGRWRGFTVKELAVSEKGKDYLSWLLSQTWCTPDKFGYIHEECKALNIKKKSLRNRTAILD